MKTFKVTNGKHTVETNDFLKNIWLRDGYEIVDEEEEEEAAEPENELTFAELRTMAKEKGINTHGMKKEEISEALGL